MRSADTVYVHGGQFNNRGCLTEATCTSGSLISAIGASVDLHYRTGGKSCTRGNLNGTDWDTLF